MNWIKHLVAREAPKTKVHMISQIHTSMWLSIVGENSNKVIKWRQWAHESN